MEDHDAADPPLRTLNVFYQGTNVEMLEETYFKFKKNILPKMKKMQPNFQEPVVEYCEPEQVIDICSYNHYPILDKSCQKEEKCNDNNDIYDTSELEHEFEYGIYEDVLKTEQLMAELKRIDEVENENKKLRDVQFRQFPLEQFSDAGKVANEYHVNYDDNTLRKMVYRPTYVPYNEDGQKLLLPQTTDMSRKDNLKLLYNSLPEGMCDNQYKS